MPKSDSHIHIVAYVKDLIFATKICSTAHALGKSISVVQSAGAMKAEIQSSRVSLAIIDLNAGNDALDAIAEALKSLSKEAVVAFVSHVDQDLMRAAEAVGAARVMPRSGFSNELPQILGG